MKVLIYSSKEIYDTAPYEGRSEADLIAYRIDEFKHCVLKNKKPSMWMYGTGEYNSRYMKRHIEWVEREELRV